MDSTVHSQTPESDQCLEPAPTACYQAKSIYHPPTKGLPELFQCCPALPQPGEETESGNASGQIHRAYLSVAG